MSASDQGRESDTLAEAVGTEDASGFHIEIYYQTSMFWEVPRRGDGTRFPCVDGHNVYSGCLGPACSASTCWAGRLVASARYAAVERVALPRVERKGARCHHCVFAVDADNGKVTCSRGHFERPITPACLVRRRIPESAPIPCPDFEHGVELRSDVATYRRLRQERERARALEDEEAIHEQNEKRAG